MTTSAIEETDREERQLATQLADARLRLRTELGTTDRPVDMVDAVFDKTVARMAEARVRSFVPILVERAVRKHFDQDAAVAAQLET